MPRWAWALLPLLGILALGADCQRIPVTPSPSTGGATSEDAGISTGGINNTGGAVSSTPCDRACENMRKRQCPGYEGADSPDGTPCEQLCFDTENSGVARFCPEEVSAATSCEGMKKAFVACEPGL